MWIVVRLVITVAAFFARYLRRHFPPKPSGKLFDGTPYYYKEHRKDKQGKVLESRVGVPLRAPMLFRLQRERASDRWFKAIGMATEFQTGDTAFDRDIYIACDHPVMLEHLQSSARARTAICAVLAAGYTLILADGGVLWIQSKVGAASTPATTEMKLLAELRDALQKSESSTRHKMDTFAARILFVEALIWSIFAYAATSYLEFRINGAENHLDFTQLILPGLVVAAIAFLLLLGLVGILLRRSSRAQHVLVEAAALLLLSLPVLGWQAASDLNRTLDSSEPLVVTREIEDATRVSRGKGPTRYRLDLAPAAGETPIDVPDSIDVTHDIFGQATAGRTLELHIGRGWLGVPWYRQIAVRDEPQRAR